MQMKPLVIFYSRIGTTKKLAESIVENLTCDVEEIFDTKNRMGLFGWLRAGRDAMRKKLTIIRETKLIPSDYDVVIMGAPNWGGMPAPTIRTYINQKSGSLKKVTFFCTSGGANNDKIFAELERLCGKIPIALLGIAAKEVKKELFINKVKDFAANIKYGTNNGF